MRLLLSGYYGFGNLGDEALLSVIVGELRRRHPALDITALSATPSETSATYGIAAIPRMDVPAVRRALGRTDVFVSGGGGLLQNATSMRSLAYYAGLIQAAMRARARVMIFAQSIGPLDRLGRLLVRAACAGIDRATVRDERSRQLLTHLLPKVPVERTADPVFMLGRADGAFDLQAEGLGPESDPLAVIALRKIPGFDAGVPALAAAVDRLAERGAKVAFLPLGGPPDAEASTIVIRKCRSTPTLLPAYALPEAAQVIAHARVVIGMRLHAVIMAARFGVPFLAVPYDPKVSGVCEDLDWPLPALWDPLRSPVPPSAAGAIALVDRLWDEREELAARLLADGERMRALAARNFDVLDELLR